MPLPQTYNDTAVNGDTGLLMLIEPSANYAPYTATPQERERQGGTPIEDGVTFSGRDVNFILINETDQTDTPLSIGAFRAWAYRHLNPHDTERRTLVALHDDGVTQIEQECRVTALAPNSGHEMVGTLHFSDPLWRATERTSGSGTSVVVQGDMAVRPVLRFEPDGSRALAHYHVTVADNAARLQGFGNYIVRIDLGAGVAADDGVIVVYQGRLVPFVGFDQGSADFRLYARVDVPNGLTTELDIFAGPPLVDEFDVPAFNDGGMKISDPAFANDNWIWDRYDLYNNPRVPGAWKYATIPADPVPGGGSYGMRFGGSNPWIELSSVDSELPNDLNAMVVSLPGLSGTGAAALTGANIYVDVLGGCVVTGILYRIDGTVFWWGTLESLSASAQLATDWALQNAVHVAFVLQGGAECDGTDAVAYIGGEIVIPIAYPPTVTVDPVAVAHYLNGTLTDTTTGATIRLRNVVIEDTDLIVDCETLTQNTDDISFWYGGAHPTGGANWIEFQPGTTTITVPAGTVVSWEFAERYAI